MAAEAPKRPDSGAAIRRAAAATGGRVRRATVTDPAERRATIRRATSRIRTDTRIDFVRSVRGR